ncbi:UbiD family decarboxylase [Desulfosporosinus acidiphilus SJ4]|uniref:UbiD family decarboxylase n=1 Tax=Desulfosporosinus acidiphilus (strain DSM 22704 / JCM 16185 / SJ4) TaxID=646529 RepID=I4D7X4_DESAJ|nr:UbiD family decarboxylase [Desulfosporosinus acidiphilus]AFM41898.1 UbiD family decarboxylase [Desulfosporosinus acidiphilus SJ4]
MHINLRQFIDTLKKEKQIVEIEAEVDPYLELAEIHRRVIQAEGPALFFKRVKGSNFPVVTNLFGTRRRVDLAVGPRPEETVQRAVSALNRLLPPKPSMLWQEKDWLMFMAKSGMRLIKPNNAPVLEIREKSVDLTRLPVLTSWPEDGGPFVTLPLVYTEHPITKEHNLGMYRIQIFNQQQTGIHWQIHKGGGFHYFEAERLGQDLPTTLFLGGPPALILSAIAPLPEMLPELMFTSFLMGEKLSRVNVPSHDHPLIAEAEFAICGNVPPHLRKPEGPFGDHYGYYSLTHDFPVFNVQAIYHRRDAIYPATVVGKPRQEDYFIGEYLQSLLSPMFPVVMPGIKSLWTYAETGFHALAAAVVRESYRREALAHAFRILGEGQLTLTKFLLLTDVQLDLKNFRGLLETVLARFEPESDLMILSETSMDTLDYTGRRLNHGSKAIMLGLGDTKRDLPGQFEGETLAGLSRIKPFCPGCLILESLPYRDAPELAEEILPHLQDEQFKNWPFIVMVDDLDLALDNTGFLWQVFTRFNPAHDIYAVTEVKQNRLVYHGPILIDARMKPDYPGEVLPDEATVRQVDDRWNKYGLSL